MTTEFATVAEEAIEKWPCLSLLKFARSIEEHPGVFENLTNRHVTSNAFSGWVKPPRLLPEQVEWFRKRNWHLALLSPTGNMSRAVCVRWNLVNAAEAFHATTAEDAQEILVDGLKTRHALNLLGDRLEAEHFIHVSRSLEHSRKWAKDPHLLAHEKEGYDSSAVILKLDLAGSDIQIYRDPFSETGWILSTDFVPQSALSEQATDN